MSDTNTPQARRLNLVIDMRLIIILLLVAVVAMLLIWKPWSSDGIGTRSIKVTGEATITAKPDEFVFYPSYEFKNADKTAALADLSKKSDDVVAKLKSLGVSDSKIKTNSSGYDMPMYYDYADNNTATYTLQLTVTVGSLDLAQKVEDYLVTTSPSGSVSPQANFSDAKQKTLEAQARDKATKDARAKGEQMAKNLGFSLGKVKTVEDGTGFGTIYPMASGSALMAQDSKTSSLQVQPGENDLNYSVAVTYFIR